MKTELLSSSHQKKAEKMYEECFFMKYMKNVMNNILNDLSKKKSKERYDLWSSKIIWGTQESIELGKKINIF